MNESHKKFVHDIKKSILPIKEFALIVERGECQFIGFFAYFPGDGAVFKENEVVLKNRFCTVANHVTFI